MALIQENLTLASCSPSRTYIWKIDPNSFSAYVIVGGDFNDAPNLQMVDTPPEKILPTLTLLYMICVAESLC